MLDEWYSLSAKILNFTLIALYLGENRLRMWKVGDMARYE